MKEFRFKIILIVAAILLSVYLLYPTFQDYQNTKSLTASLKSKKNELIKLNPDLTKDQLEKRLTLVEDSIKIADPSILEARKKRVSSMQYAVCRKTIYCMPPSACCLLLTSYCLLSFRILSKISNAAATALLSLLSCEVGVPLRSYSRTSGSSRGWSAPTPPCARCS